MLHEAFGAAGRPAGDQCVATRPLPVELRAKLRAVGACVGRTWTNCARCWRRRVSPASKSRREGRAPSSTSGWKTRALANCRVRSSRRINHNQTSFALHRRNHESDCRLHHVPGGATHRRLRSCCARRTCRTGILPRTWRIFRGVDDGGAVITRWARSSGAGRPAAFAVVAPAWRGRRRGGLCAGSPAAGAWGVGRWWLLTTTAVRFPRAGFWRSARRPRHRDSRHGTVWRLRRLRVLPTRERRTQRERDGIRRGRDEFRTKVGVRAAACATMPRRTT